MPETKLTITDVCRAIELATACHREQVDKAGEPYILHPLRVMFLIRDQYWDEKTQIVAVLHDTVEDTALTLEDITHTFGKEVAEAVDALSRRENETYTAFIKRIKPNPIARAVKVADLMDNLDEKRMSVLSEYERKGMTKRYRNAAKFLLSGDDEYPEMSV